MALNLRARCVRRNRTRRGLKGYWSGDRGSSTQRACKRLVADEMPGCACLLTERVSPWYSPAHIGREPWLNPYCSSRLLELMETERRCAWTALTFRWAAIPMPISRFRLKSIVAFPSDTLRSIERA